MDESLEHSAEEFKRLQRCINDLVSVLALPAMWSGGEPSQIIHTLLDALLGMLGLDLVYARLKDPGGEAPVETVRVAQSRGLMLPPQEICKALNQSFGDEPQKWSPLVRNPIGDRDISIVPLPLGLHGEIGVIVAGSQRADFPGQAERLILTVAANQASISLQEARLRTEHKRVASELDRRVALRTAELAAANEELRKEVGDHKLAEEKLRREERELKRSEARNAAILDSVLDCIVTIDHEGRITEFNPAAEKTFGYDRDEVMGRRLADVIIPPSQREGHSQGLARYLATGETRVLGRRLEMTAVRAGGSEFPVELAITRIPLDGPPSFTGYLRDITERKRNEGALREALAQVARSEERWRSVFENSAVGVALTDLDGRFIATNPVYQKMLGYTEEEMQNLSFHDITHEEYLEPNRILIVDLIEGSRQQFQIEKRYRRKDGKSVWVRNNVSLVPGTERAPRFLMALSEDITERKQAEEKLLQSERDLHEAQRLSHMGSWKLDPSSGRVTISPEVLRIFAAKSDEDTSSSKFWFNRIHSEDRRRVQEHFERCLTQKVDYEDNYRIVLPDGTIKHQHAIGHPILNESGALVEFFGTAMDVTEQVQAQEELRNIQAELAHMTRVMTVGVLTASIAHEVRQPLSGIITNASTCLRMLASDPPNVDGARETARRTIRDGDRASEVITRLRALFSKKESTPESMNLNEAAREVIALSLSELQRNRVILRSELADNLPLVTGDRVQLQQVILNLLQNASEAMSTIDGRPRQLVIRTERDEGDHVRMTVKDAGVGLDPQALDRLFEAFYTTKNEGMGIGLSVSRSIIESHNGRLWAAPNDGPGATFSFSIPCRPEGLRGESINRAIRSPSVTDAA